MSTIRFLQVGFGDTTIITTDTETFLIDCYNIEKFSPYLPADKSIKGVFITHQHYDHFIGLEFLLNNQYSIDYLICSPYSRRHDDNSVEYDEWQKFLELENHFKKQGTKVCKPFRQEEFDKPYWIVSGLKIWMIGPEESIAKKILENFMMPHLFLW